jgi:pantoate--beta-alanine ligase
VLIFTKIPDLQAVLADEKLRNRTVGFVPTMGALHEGHLSLIHASRQSTDVTTCSIFVNPTQFDDRNDLLRYPRTPGIDTGMLEKAGCDTLFMPSDEEMYPSAARAKFDFGQLGKVLEGARRPGHFNGVAQVVKRLFEIVKPDLAFFGTKDYQQLLIVKALVKQMGSHIRIIGCPIMREPDGLAMSSRNKLLDAQERKAAGYIPIVMQEAREIVMMGGIKKAKSFVANEISKQPLLKLDYYEVCDPTTLEALSEYHPGAGSIALIAVYAGKIRLIDNLICD